MTDEVAAKSGFLCMYMSNHPDTLVAYVRYYGQIKEPVSSAQMMSIDSTVCFFCTLSALDAESHWKFDRV